MPKKLSQEQVIERFRSIHGSIYDYTLVEYKNDSTKVKIVCKKHGIFEQQPSMHGRMKQGCPVCAKESHINPTPKIDQDVFIKRVKSVYGDIFDFSCVEYKGAHIPVKLRCIKHNINFEADPNTLYRGHHVCQHCETEYRIKKHSNIWTPKFLESAKQVHGDVYDYSKILYVNQYTKIEIVCNKHGSFLQKPSDHIHGRNGCPVCQNSQGEERISNYLRLKCIPFGFQYRVEIDDSYHYYDFYLPDYNIIIEFNGAQHYEAVNYFGGNDGLVKLQLRDAIKAKYCSDNNIKFVIISYKEFDNIEQILDNVL